MPPTEGASRYRRRQVTGLAVNLSGTTDSGGSPWHRAMVPVPLGENHCLPQTSPCFTHPCMTCM